MFLKHRKREMENLHCGYTKLLHNRTTMAEKRITIPIPKDTHAKLKELRKARGTSKNWEARKILIAAVEKEFEAAKV